ncbi:MAG: acyltransferase family protein, partial [Minisyncoccota bacterium]
YRFVHWENYEIIRYMTFSVFSDLAIGCLLAYLVFFKKGFVEFFERLPSWAILINYILVLGYPVLRGVLSFIISGRLYQTMYALESVIFCILFAVIIMEQCFSKNSFFKVGNSKTLTYLGKISYGLYVYHMIAMTSILWFAVTFFGLPLEYNSLSILLSIGIATFLITLFFSYISYKYMEKPILRLKEKIGYLK